MIGKTNAGGGINTKDATASADMIVFGKTAYVDGEKVTGALGTESTILTTFSSIVTQSGINNRTVLDNDNNTVAWFGGSNNSSSSNNVQYTDSTLTVITATALEQSSYYHGAIYNKITKRYMLGGGVYYSSTKINKVTAYNSDFTQITGISGLDYNVSECSASHTGNGYTVFSGGNGSNYLSSSPQTYDTNAVNIYSPDLTKMSSTRINYYMHQTIGGNVGQYAIMYGGYVWHDNSSPYYFWSLNNNLTLQSHSTSERKCRSYACNMENKLVVPCGCSNPYDGSASNSIVFISDNLSRSTIYTSFASANHPGAIYIPETEFLYVISGTNDAGRQVFNSSLTSVVSDTTTSGGGDKVVKLDRCAVYSYTTANSKTRLAMSKKLTIPSKTFITII